MSHAQTPSSFNPYIGYLLYPALFCIMVGYAYLELQQATEQIGRYYAYYVTGLILSLMLIEAMHPAQRAWRMSRQTLFSRDIPYMIIGDSTMALAQYLTGMAVIKFGISQGEAHRSMSLIPAVILALLIMDFIWYWIHRFSHESKSRLGLWLWKMHLAHHLPQQVYVLMHAVGHPINTLIARSIFSLPLYFMGFSVEAVFITNLIVGLQATISHFNVDLRVGWVNYLLVGTELHRYHHSADPKEGKNYASVVPIWDILFGTFYFKPKQLPQQLGVAQPDRYPIDRQVWQVLLLPFKKEKVVTE